MKKLIFFTALVVTLSGCKKEISVDEVMYEVTLINSTTWHGSYVDKNAQVISISNGTNGWTHTFKNTNNIFGALIMAYPDGLSANTDAMMKIYVNGKIVASSLCSVFPQALYEFHY